MKISKEWIKRHIFGCQDDKIFSGHVSFAICMVLCMLQHKIIHRVWFWCMLLVFYGIFSTMSRSHYTIDVVAAFVVVPLFYDWINNQSGSKKLLFSV